MQEYQINDKILWYEDDLNWGFGLITGYSPDGGVYEITTPHGQHRIVMDTDIVGKVQEYFPGDIHK
jgi:hypothetical protein